MELWKKDWGSTNSYPLKNHTCKFVKVLYFIFLQLISPLSVFVGIFSLFVTSIIDICSYGYSRYLLFCTHHPHVCFCFHFYWIIYVWALSFDPLKGVRGSITPFNLINSLYQGFDIGNSLYQKLWTHLDNREKRRLTNNFSTLLFNFVKNRRD